MAFRGSIIAALMVLASVLPLLASCATKPAPDDGATDRDHADHTDHSHDDSGGGGYSSA